MRHNEIRDSLGDLCAMAFPEVIREPVVREADESNDVSSLIADLGVRGLWLPQCMGLIDVRVVDTDAPSYMNRLAGYRCYYFSGRRKKEKTFIC